MSNEIRRNMALFPIGIVMKLTDLTARQIRYYEQHELLCQPEQRVINGYFPSMMLRDCLRSKSLIEKGVNIAGIKQVINPVNKDSDDATIYNEQTEVEAQRTVGFTTS